MELEKKKKYFKFKPLAKILVLAFFLDSVVFTNGLAQALQAPILMCGGHPISKTPGRNFVMDPRASGEGSFCVQVPETPW